MFYNYSLILYYFFRMGELLKEFRQDTDFEMLGQFVYAGKSLDEGVTGKIIYKKDGLINRLELEIYGELFESDLDYNLSGFDRLYKIIGFTNNGFTVIIDKAVKKAAHVSYPGIPYTRYSVSRCLFLNINYSKSFDVISNQLSEIGIDNLKVNSCEYSIAGIDEWIDETNVSYKKIEKKYRYEVDIDNINEDIFLIKDENLKISSGMEFITGSSGFKEKFYWNLESIDNQELIIKSIMDKLKIFKELLDIFITVPIDFSYLKFKIPIEQMDNKLVTGYLVTGRINTDNYRRINTDIPYNKIKENFSEILCNWYKKRNKLALISQNLITNKYSRQFNQSVLLNSIKNLEIYHRNFVQEEIEINEILAKDKELVLEFIRKNIKNKTNIEKFERNINFDSEMTLKKRLKELFRGLDDTLLNKLVQNQSGCRSDRIGKFTQKLVNTRNYYTHGDPKALEDMVIIDNVELIETTLLLNQIIKYYIYKELFEPDDEIINIILKGMHGVIK